MITLSTLVPSLAQLTAPIPVATRDGQTLSSHDLLNDISAFHQAVKSRPEKTWGVYLEDSYNFTVAFLALLHAQKTPILLPNAQPDFLAKVQPHLDTVLLTTHPTQPCPPQEFQPLENSKIALFTSGSTGEPKKIQKELIQIEAELACLEGTFGPLKDTTTLSTVSHQHIYGLLFSVLWPLCTQRVIEAECYHYPNDLVARIARAHSVTLISSPSHLARFPELVDLKPYQDKVKAVFSSGAPLHRDASIRIRALLNLGVTEVFGSTETGGIAYRSQSSNSHDARWTPFRVVQTQKSDATDVLQIRSPYLPTTDWHTTDDRIEQHDDGRFTLLGRADRVVKIEGKRLSLPEMEHRLQNSPLIQHCRALMLSGSRASTAVVLVPSKEGMDYLAQSGKPKLCARLKDELAGYFERVLLPRKWRFVHELPLNQMGKITQESLERLFRDTHPTVLSTRGTENRIELELHVPESLKYFQGHFPGRPILPGVAQLDWAADFSKTHLHAPGNFQKLEAVKFYDFIEPDARVTLTLEYKPEKAKIYFSYNGEARRHSSGRLVFG